jgi:opacity protein-like surface antigen
MKLCLTLLAFYFVSSIAIAEEPVAAPPQSNEREHKAGIFIEPALTYERSESTVNYPEPFANSSGNVDGFGIGARLGFHLNEVVFLGVDGRYSMPKFKDSSYDAKAVSTNWGPVAGIQMPNLGLRLWGSMILGGNLNPDSSGNLDIKFKDTSGYRVGAGIRFEILSLNLEYQHAKYGETVLEQIGPFATTTTFSNVTLKNNSWVASVSFPLAL